MSRGSAQAEQEVIAFGIRSHHNLMAEDPCGVGGIRWGIVFFLWGIGLLLGIEDRGFSKYVWLSIGMRPGDLCWNVGTFGSLRMGACHDLILVGVIILARKN